MTPDAIRETLRTIGWSGREFGRRIGCSPNYAHEIIRGDVPWPAQLTPWLLDLARAHQVRTPPRWRE